LREPLGGVRIMPYMILLVFFLLVVMLVSCFL
jgi:hypothetical protein